MKVKITKRSGHPVYGEGGMFGKLKYGFEKLGHEVVEEGEELLIVPGSSAEIPIGSNSIWWSHGCNWARGFENEDNKVLKNNFDNCKWVAYQSEFAKHMVEKAFGKKDGPIVFNASIPMLPEVYPKFIAEPEVRLVCCSIWRAWKRLHEIERLVRLLADRGYRIHLSVIGKDPRDNCPFDLPKEGPNYKIEYLGLMDIHKMKEIYWKSHVGVHLAFNDYSPAVVTEMMACGLPVIVTNSGGSRDLNPNIIYTDPFVDTPFNIHSEGVLPKVDEMQFEKMLASILVNLEKKQQENAEWVLSKLNCVKSAEELLNLYEKSTAKSL